MDIKQARKEVGMTQQNVQDQFGIPRRSLQNWEAGIRDCPEYVVEYLLEKYSEVKYIKRTAELLNEKWQLANDDNNPTDISYYTGAIKSIECMGYSVKRDEEGLHTIIARKNNK